MYYVFLKDLNDTYILVKSQILLMNALLPPISQCYSPVLQQERPPTAPTFVDSVVLAANQPSKSNLPQGRGRGRANQRHQMLCTPCHRTNHTIDTCYFKHGFPPGYRTMNTRNALLITSSTTDSAFLSDAPPNSTPHISSEQQLPITREDYQYLISLLHASRIDHGTSTHPTSKPSSSDTAPT